MTSKSRLALLVLALAFAALAASETRAQPGTVEKIEIQGLRRMSRESFLEAFGLRPGDPYDPDRVRSAFRRLWDRKLFSDIVVEAEEGPEGGKVLIVKVQERPVLSSVSYEDNKAVTRTQIEDRLSEQEIPLELGRPLDMKRIFEAESAIRDMLGQKGYLDASVSHEVREVTETSRSVHFSIRPGGKTRIRKIVFVGNEIFSDRRLRQALELTQARKWYWPWSSKSLYHPIKWDQDAGGLRDLYLDGGYLDVEIKPPVVEVVQKKKDREEDDAAPVELTPKQIAEISKARKKLEEAREELDAVRGQSPPEELTGKKLEKWMSKQRDRVLAARKNVDKREEKLEKTERKLEPVSKKWVALTVRVSEGPQYKTGDINFEGNTVFRDDQLRALIPLRSGVVLSNALLKFGIDRITIIYGDRGYLYADVVRQIRRRPDEPVADVTISVSEDQPYHVDSIEFTGNRTTHDRVLRRELRLNETDLFSRSRLDLSMRKVNQLGYWEARDDPVIEPIEGENQIRIRIAGEEKGRNEVQVGGGYSGLDGAFFTGFYSTRNFLGRGQILTTSMQIGGRSTRYAISFIEPWFLAKPYTLGFSLFRRDTDFGGDLTSSGKGGGVIFGKQLGAFSGYRVNYNFESVTSTGFTVSGGRATNRISSVTPAYSINKINNPVRPSRGWSLDVQTQVAGGFLGGDTSFVKPVITYTGYRRALRRSFFGLHARVGQVNAFQGGSDANTSSVEGIPRFQRFWLGGESFGPRVFDTRTVTPLRFVSLNPDGTIARAVEDPRGFPIEDFDLNGDGVLNRGDLVELGGDRFFLIQSELIYPVSEQFDVALFFDVGNSIFEDTSWGFDDARVSAGVELRFHLPVFPVPLRLIYGFPLRKLQEDRTSNFTFSIGRSF